MKINSARGNNLHLGLFRYLFILGVGRGAAGASDFTDADAQQDYTLLTPAAGDAVTYPLAQAYTKIGFAGGALSAVTLDVGFSNGSEFLLNGAMFALNACAVSPLVSGAGGPKFFDGATALTARIDTTGANLSEITKGEIWIYVNLITINEALKLIDA